MREVEDVLSLERDLADASQVPSDERRAADLALADHCRLNVLWFHGTWPGERALHLRTAAFDLREALAAFCRHVEHASETDLKGRGTDRARLHFPDRSFDLATLYGGEPTLGLLSELRRILKPEACALIAVENCWSVGRWRYRGRNEVGVASATMLKAMALRAGFADVNRYWVEPSLEKPRSLVPIASGRSRLLEQMRTRERGANRFHAAALAFGMPQLLYPALMMVARA